MSKKITETGDSRYDYHNELYQACLQHDMAYREFKDLNRRQLLIKCYVIKHLILVKIKNMMDINVNLLQWSINFLIKKTSGGTVKTENISN